LKYKLKEFALPFITGPAITAFANYFIGRSVPVFMLHRMISPEFSIPGGISEAYLRQCLQYLKKNHYHFLSLESLVQALRNHEPLPARSVVFTIDDGYLDQAQIALPVFEEFGCPITFFVITGMLDQTLWPWDAQIAWLIQHTPVKDLHFNIAENPVRFPLDNAQNKRLSRRTIQDYLKTVNATLIPGFVDELAEKACVEIPQQPPPEYMPLSWEQARQLESNIVRFAPHSDTHNILSRLDDKILDNELKNSWQKISSELQHPVKIFCYPTGRPEDYGVREIEALNRLDYIAAVSTTAAAVDLNNRSQHQLFTLPRYSLPSTMGDFIQYCSWIEFTRNKTVNLK
jgi:peptidoglycan/xylan/chitin deacetylase (PgdA/CDA1 family)